MRSIIEKLRLDKAGLFFTNGTLMPEKQEAGSSNHCVSCILRDLDYRLVDVLPLLSSDITAPSKEDMVCVASYIAFKHCGTLEDDTTNTRRA